MRNLLFKGYNKKHNIDFTVHSCNKYLLHEIISVFKNSFKKVYLKEKDYLLNNLKIVCTWQRSDIPINFVSKKVTKEMDKLYENFIKFIKKIKQIVEKKNLWIDVSDPHTGNCLFGKKTNCIYNEINGLKYLLKYDNEKLGCCGMVLHPEYGYHGYPITFFTNLNLSDLKNLLIIA